MATRKKAPAKPDAADTRPDDGKNTQNKAVTVPKARTGSTTGPDLTDDGSQTVADLVKEGARLVKSYSTLHRKEVNLARDITAAVIRLRARCRDKNGRPDLRGRSQEYRDAVAKMYERAGIPTDAAGNLQSLVRYHMSDVRIQYMRANGYTDKDFEYYGVSTKSKRERFAEQRREKAAANAATLSALKVDKKDPAGSAVRIVQRVERNIRAVTEDPEVLNATATLIGEQREDFAKTLDRLDEAIALIRAAM